MLIASQFCGTSLWFAGNAILPQLQEVNGWATSSLGYLTSAVQLGFIVGTLVSAVYGLSDRMSPSKLFFISSMLGAGVNSIALLDLSSLELVIASRFATGFFLAGIYPVGMKIAADWSEKGLGLWLGALVGALVLGTAFPQIIRSVPNLISAKGLLISVSLLCAIGGLLVLLLIKDGPFRKVASRFSFQQISTIYQSSELRNSAFGYFGHMWELYAFWAFVPWWITQFNITAIHKMNVPLWSFVVIAFGFIGCVFGGLISRKVGSKSIALGSLIISGLCCLLSPIILDTPLVIFLIFMMIWGASVVSDSPQLSALIATSAPAEIKGSAITLSTCIGFAITIGSIQLLSFLQGVIPNYLVLIFLLPGPLIGIGALRKNTRATGGF